jgi:hypothetical protein
MAGEVAGKSETNQVRAKRGEKAAGNKSVGSESQQVRTVFSLTRLT